MMSLLSPRLDTEHLDKINSHIYRSLGIHISAEKRYLLEARVTKILNKEGFSSLQEFVGALDAGEPASWDALIKHTTTNHTFFFREEGHFAYLADRLMERKSSRPVIWSAACSTGEEPYSIIITLLERGLRDFTVVASDINAEVLHQAAVGIFPTSRMVEMVPHLRHKYFRKHSVDRWEVSPSVRQHIRLKKLNLVNPVQFHEAVDHIFCRNMLIYFDQPGCARVVANLTRNLKPDGLLFIGKSEVLLTPPPGLHKLEGSIYQREKRIP